jgi:hypothetical protein
MAVADNGLIRNGVGGLAASAFIAVTQVLGVPLDMPLYIALTLFAAMIPLQLMLFYTPVRRDVRPGVALTPLQKGYWLILMGSTTLNLAGFIALFCHFGWWIGVLFGISTIAAFEIYRHWANQATQKHETDSRR